MKKYKLTSTTTTGSPTLRMNCPHCGHNGVFESVGMQDLVDSTLQLTFGQRKCPNPDCKGHVFVIMDNSRKLVQSYPSETIPFNKDRIPEKIVNAFEEAIQCFGNGLFIAAAIMIRKTLEELCNDKSATGNNLKEKIADLGTKIIIPRDLLSGIDDLRLLGNDAAHIEAQVFDEIGHEEIKISLEFSIEMLKAVYQYEALLEKLKSLKKTT